VIGLPSVAGAVHETVTLPSPAITVGAAGFAGTPYGTTDVEGVDVVPVPFTLWAFTVNVYDLPLVSPVTVHVRVPEVVHDLCVAVVDVTVYLVMAAPFVTAGVQLTFTDALPGTTDGFPGFPGGVDSGVAPIDAVEYRPVPLTLWAFTLK
jgi:hypothetical protein